MNKKAPKMTITYLFPLGSVVMLKGGKHRLMIIGHNLTQEKELNYEGQILVGDNKKPLVHQYAGVLWPEGDALPGKIALFNHEDIGKVYFVGFDDETGPDFKSKYEEEIKKIDSK